MNGAVDRAKAFIRIILLLLFFILIMNKLRFTSLNVRNMEKNFLFMDDLMLSSEVCYLTETWLHDRETEELRE
jgi:hypothetical protein